MFEFSLPEMFVVFVVALVVLGPERLPKVARTLGLLVGRARALWAGARAELEREGRLQELDELRRQGLEIEKSLRDSVDVQPPAPPAAPPKDGQS